MKIWVLLGLAALAGGRGIESPSEPGTPFYAHVYKFMQCFAGPDGGIHREDRIWCAPYDWDKDLDVDLWDFAQLQNLAA